MEECGEVIQEASKIMRFGNDASKLTKELGDLQFMINLTANHLGIDSVSIGVYANEKRDKLKKYSDLISNWLISLDSFFHFSLDFVLIT